MEFKKNTFKERLVGVFFTAGAGKLVITMFVLCNV